VFQSHCAPEGDTALPAQMTVGQLRTLLQSQGLPTDGRKADLVARLEAALAAAKSGNNEAASSSSNGQTAGAVEGGLLEVSQEPRPVTKSDTLLGSGPQGSMPQTPDAVPPKAPGRGRRRKQAGKEEGEGISLGTAAPDGDSAGIAALVKGSLRTGDPGSTGGAGPAGRKSRKRKSGTLEVAPGTHSLQLPASAKVGCSTAPSVSWAPSLFQFSEGFYESPQEP
jgi:SAP domain